MLPWHHYKHPYWLYQGLPQLPHWTLTWLQFTLLTLNFYCGCDETVSLVAILSAHLTSSHTFRCRQLLPHDKNHLGFVRVSSNIPILDHSLRAVRFSAQWLLLFTEIYNKLTNGLKLAKSAPPREGCPYWRHITVRVISFRSSYCIPNLRLIA